MLRHVACRLDGGRPSPNVLRSDQAAGKVGRHHVFGGPDELKHGHFTVSILVQLGQDLIRSGVFPHGSVRERLPEQRRKALGEQFQRRL